MRVLNRKSVVIQFISGVREPLPAPKTGGLYKINCHQQGGFCRGLSVPFTVSVHGEPCSAGLRGHFSFQTESPPKNATLVPSPPTFYLSLTIRRCAYRLGAARRRCAICRSIASLPLSLNFLRVIWCCRSSRFR